jgi:L,D-transpeptidase catalytic domain
MMVIEQDAITMKWRPTIQTRRETRASAFNGSLPGRKGRVKNMRDREFSWSHGRRICADIAKRFRFCPIYVRSRPKKHRDFTVLSTVRIGLEFVMRCRAIIIAGALSMLIGVESAEARLEIMVEKASQRMIVIQDGYMRYIWPISTGRDSLETPNGTYTPQRLERSWFSSEYYNSPMPYAIFFHNGYAIHGSYAINQLGGPASHGCVRLHPHHAALLFDLVQQEGPGNTSIEVTDEPPRPEMPPLTRDGEQAREASAATLRPAAFGDMAELSAGPRAVRSVNMRPPLPMPPPSLRDSEQAREPSMAMPRPERFGQFGDMAEPGPGPRVIRPVNVRPPLPPRYPPLPASRRQLTNLIEPARPRAPCGSRPDSADCRAKPKSVEATPRERAEAPPPPQPAPPAQPVASAPQASGFKVLPASCWSGGASRWQWWRSGQDVPCR